MQTKMSVMITIKGQIDSKKLYGEIKKYNVNVMDLIDITIVSALIDIRKPDIAIILETCRNYGECEVEAHLVDEKDS